MEASRLTSHEVGHATTQLGWFVRGAALAFAIPFLGTTVFDLHHDVYLGLYMSAVVVWLYYYARHADVDVLGMFRRHWVASLAVAGVLLAPLVSNVLSEDATARPHGAYFVFELIWRGGLYGAVDALLLTAFPCAVVFAALGGDLGTWRRKVTYALGSLALVVTITAAYHLGYDQYRQDGVGAPEKGNVLISAPALLTANPIGSLVDHAGMHISAVSHEYETDVRLPPQTDAH